MFPTKCQARKRGLATDIPLLYEFESKIPNERFLCNGNRQKIETKHCRRKGIL